MFWKIILFLQMNLLKALSLFAGLIPKKRNKDILYLAAFFPGNAGYHWRVQKWSELMQLKGLKVDVVSACSKADLDQYDKNPSKFLSKILSRRFWQVLQARQYKTVIVRREIWIFSAYGNHFLEKLLNKCCAHCILDFDDDIAAAKQQPKEIDNFYAGLLQDDGNSFRNSFHYYQKFIVASNYLKEYVLKYANQLKDEQIAVIPTCVDYDNYPVKEYVTQKDNLLTLGWIGSPNNYVMLESILPQLERVYTNFPFQLKVIGDGAFSATTSFPILNEKWSLETEIAALYTIDIGLMPLIDNEESKGKGAFKLIQYMGLGIVSVASAITINKEIIDHGRNSILVDKEEDWVSILTSIVSGEINLKSLGERARNTIDDGFTFNSNSEKYYNFIQLGLDTRN